MVIALTPAGSTLAASGPIVECGQLTAYVAPDPIAPASGSIGIGTLTPWEVTATATVSTDAAANLPSIVNSGPTCVALVLDSDEKVTSIDFAPEGDITGHVEFDGTYYLFADRLIIPEFITDAYPGLAALFVTSFQAEKLLTVRFSVDTTTGAFTGVDGKATFCGKAGLTGGGDGKIGEVRIPAEVLSTHDAKVLKEASGMHACAAIHTAGVIGSQGDIDIDTDVKVTVDAVADAGPPDPPDTSTITPASGQPGRALPQILVLVLALGVLAVTRRRAGAATR